MSWNDAPKGIWIHRPEELPDFDPEYDTPYEERESLAGVLWSVVILGLFCAIGAALLLAGPGSVQP